MQVMGKRRRRSGWPSPRQLFRLRGGMRLRRCTHTHTRHFPRKGDFAHVNTPPGCAAITHPRTADVHRVRKTSLATYAPRGQTVACGVESCVRLARWGGIVSSPPPKVKSKSRQLLRIGMSVVLVLAVVWYVKNNVASFSDVWAEIKAMSPVEIGVLVVFALWNLATYWIITVLSTPGMTYPQAIVQTETTTAVANTVPA